MQEIAAALGFANASSFYKAFKRWTGQTPTQFLMALKKDAPSAKRDERAFSRRRKQQAAGPAPRLAPR